ETHLESLLESASDPIKQDVIRLAIQLEIPGGGDILARWVNDSNQKSKTRIDALKLLAQQGDDRLEDLVDELLAGPHPELRVAAGRVLARQNPERTADLLIPIANDSQSMTERQQTISTLGGLKHPRVDAAITSWLDQLIAGSFPKELHLDLIEAAGNRDDLVVGRKFAEYQATLAADDKLANYRPALHGGNYQRGKDIFVGHMKVKCIRCHKVRQTGGSAGPELTNTGVQNSREYLLESIVDPNATIAKGFETTVIMTEDGRIVSGIVQDENQQRVRLLTPKLKTVDVQIDRINDRFTGKSAMPEEMGTQIDMHDLRDLVEFLTTLGRDRQQPAPSGKD
ncbi:MAG: HEAT repeat domain-containing protein, partial [Planctomycetales bacterium]